MRILHLLKTSTGATWALRQVCELVRLGVEVHVALPPGGPLVPSYEAAGSTVHPVDLALPIRKPARWSAALNQMRALVSAVQPDLIHSHFVATTLTMRLALGRKHATPRLFQVPGPLHLEHALFRMGEIATAGPGDYWAGSCLWTQDRYRRSGIEADRVFLCYYGIDFESFRCSRPGALRAELGITAETKLAGMVAHIYAPKRYLGQSRGLKGHEDFIDALALCRQAGWDVQGVVIGGAWAGAEAYERKVREYAHARLGGRVHFLGARSDVARLYPDLDVAVHPSLSENVGGAVESLALAVPTVATAVGGLPDLVRPEQTGWLVPPRDPGQLANVIIDAIQRPERARRMARAGQQLARQLLDVRSNARDMLAIYQTILDRRVAEPDQESDHSRQTAAPAPGHALVGAEVGSTRTVETDPHRSGTKV